MLQGTASKLIEMCLGARDFPRFRSDGGDEAVAALVGSDTAQLSELNYFGLVGLGLYMYVWGFVS